MSFGQTLIHYSVAHHPIGGGIFRNHINFHYTHSRASLAMMCNWTRLSSCWSRFSGEAT
jgi:hypothetical protein